jgi:hypothetical protein
MPGQEAHLFFPLNKKQLSIPINKKEKRIERAINRLTDMALPKISEIISIFILCNPLLHFLSTYSKNL